MKRLIPLLLLLSGCIVQSLQPFASEDNKVAVPELTGEWTLVSNYGEDVTEKKIRPWVFSESKVVTSDENNILAPIKVQYFRVGDVLLCQSTLGDIEEAKINWFWIWHTAPVRTLCKVEVKANQARFLPLDLEWLKKQMEDGKVTLSHVYCGDKEEAILFTASTAQWTELLKQHAAKAETFDEKHAYVFKRSTPPQSSTSPTPDSPPR